MRPERFDCVDVVSGPGETATRIVQTNGTWSRLPGVALMSLLAGVVVAPQIALAAYALAAPSARHAMAAAPEVAVQLALAMIVWIGLICWPLRVALSRLARRRTIELTDGAARVTDSNPFGQTAWTEPLTQFTGVAHHIRTSISGVRHEIVLGHPTRGRSLVLRVGEHIAEAEVLAWSRRTGRPVLSAGELYRVRRPAAAAVNAAGAIAPLSAAA